LPLHFEAPDADLSAMTTPKEWPTRWAAVLALTMGAALTFDNVLFGPLGALALPVAIYAAGSATGWARKDAVAIAAASVFVAFFGMLTAGHFPSSFLVVFDLVTIAVLRPHGRRNLGYRFALSLVWFLVAIRVGAWWTVLFVPSVVAAADELASLTAPSAPELSPGGAPGHLEPAFAGSGQIAGAAPAEGDAPAGRTASPALALASLACFLLVAFGFFATTGSIAPLLVTLASAVSGAVLAIRSFRTDPIRAVAALMLAAIPLAFCGFLLLILFSGGMQIVG
jgi:hypothetical protein